MDPGELQALLESFDGEVVEHDPVERRKLIERFEDAFAQMPGIAENSDRVIEEATAHHHCAGVYCREYKVKKGYAVTGRVHKYPCINIVLYGDVMCAMGEWPEPRRLTGGTMFISGAGEKKALFAYEDTVFLTFHATDETDPEKLWDKFTFPTVEKFESYKRDLLEHKEDGE